MSSKLKSFFSRNPTIKIRSRCCGTHDFASTTFQWTWYPRSSRECPVNDLEGLALVVIDEILDVFQDEMPWAGDVR